MTIVEIIHEHEAALKIDYLARLAGINKMTFRKYLVRDDMHHHINDNPALKILFLDMRNKLNKI